MKYIFFLLVAVFACAGCNQKQGSNVDQAIDTLSNQAPITNGQPKAWKTPADLMTHSDAEIILGGKASLMDSVTSIDSDVPTYKTTHTAHEVDTAGLLSNLYFMYEDYPTEEGAMRIYRSIRASDMAKPGFVNLTGMGDEACFHTDGTFYYFMSRKGRRMIRLKVNKVTERTSLLAFQEISKRITDSL